MKNKEKASYILLIVCIIIGIIVALTSCTKEYSAEPVKQDTTYHIVIYPGRHK